jgi:hypothetical protein
MKLINEFAITRPKGEIARQCRASPFGELPHRDSY